MPQVYILDLFELFVSAMKSRVMVLAFGRHPGASAACTARSHVKQYEEDATDVEVEGQVADYEAPTCANARESWPAAPNKSESQYLLSSMIHITRSMT